MAQSKSDKTAKPAATKNKRSALKKAASPSANTKKGLRRLRFRRGSRPKPQTKLSGSFKLFRDSVSLMRQYWKPLGGIVIVYFALTILLTGMNLGTDISLLKQELNKTFADSLGGLGVSLVLFADLVSSAGGTSDSGSIFPTLLTLITSLAIIWALRQLLAGHRIMARDAFYKGMYPLVPVLLVLVVIGLQLIPAMIGGFLYNTIFAGGLAVTVVEKILWGGLVFGLIVVSLYLVTSSIFAFYIVTLPDMRPMRALRSARKLVRYRRWSIMRKLLFLPLALLVVGAFITVPFILIWAPFAPWIFAFGSMIGLVFVHVYMYSLYKELL